MKRKIDWQDGRWAVLVPYVTDHGHTHYLHPNTFDFRRQAISEAVSRFDSSPHGWGENITSVYPKWQRAAWKRLYEGGYRVIRVKVRGA